MKKILILLALAGCAFMARAIDLNPADLIDQLKSQLDQIKGIGSEVGQLVEQAGKTALDDVKNLASQLAKQLKSVADQTASNMEHVADQIKDDTKLIANDIVKESKVVLSDMGDALGAIVGLAKEGLGSFEKCENVMTKGLEMPPIIIANEVARAALTVADDTLKNAQFALSGIGTATSKIAVPFENAVYHIAQGLISDYQQHGFDIKNMHVDLSLKPAKFDFSATVDAFGKMLTVAFDPSDVTSVGKNVLDSIKSKI